jgi:predicted DNA binding CopG/RHH family protein
MQKHSPKKSWPLLRSDEDAERFVETADLSEYDFTQMKPMRFEFEKKSGALNMRIPVSLLDAVKYKASTKGIPFTRYIRMLIEQDVANPS